MRLVQACLSLVRKYGPAAKVVVTNVLNVVAPGSGTLIDLAGQAIDRAREVADKMAQEAWEREMLARLRRSEAELARLGQLLETLSGPLAAVCDEANRKADQLEELPDIIARAIAADPALSQVLHQVGGLKEQFDVFQADLKRLADHQDEAAPVYARMNRVADYFDELWQAGITPSVFAQCLRTQRTAARSIERDETGRVGALVIELRTATPKAASVCVLEAAAATREFNYPAAQRALGSALRLRPGDAGLADLSRRVTKLATGATPPLPQTPAQPRRLHPGATLDGWLLEARLGAGGWGQVLKASRDSQVRALKVMHPDYAAEQTFVERFKKEIETLIKLPRHANLVRIEGFGFCTVQQTWYLTMEHIDGLTLEQLLSSRGPLTEAQVRKAFAGTIDGLARAHVAGIVHRDIKPGNLIFRKSDRRLVLVDFGLAVGVEDFGETKVGGISVQFAAPEQHYGERATQASDVFSLCAVMHYALHYDKPELRKPHRFSPSQAPEGLRDALTRGLKANVAERLLDAGHLLQVFLPVAMRVDNAKPMRKIGDVIEIPLTSSLKMKFAWVPPGQGWLGGGGGKPGQSPFTLPTGLWCGVYPVTQAEWQAIMGDNPSWIKSPPRHPVESVPWRRVQEFLKTLNTKLRDGGLLYRLPTEQEWEYICRGGHLSSPDQSKYQFYFAKSRTDLTPVRTNDLSSRQANFNGEYPTGSAPKGPDLQATSEVGLYLPNPLGVYDLHGNVWEWTSSEEDWGQSDYKPPRHLRRGSERTSSEEDLRLVVRGGSWGGNGLDCTASVRGSRNQAEGGGSVGFRLLAVPVE
jgi:formylglycine-generating enzyme required for sulfatase activity/tRNA A-37 threonylcarbamoyl transferase component Bud32